MSSWPSRALPALALVAALVLAACGDGSEPAPGATTTAGADETEAADAAQGADLPDGVAAEVGDTEISSDRVDERVDKALQNEQLSSRLPDDPEQARDLVEANVLGQMIVTEAVLQAADESGIEVTDEEVAAEREELEEQAGGADALEQQVADIGFSEEELDQELRRLAILEKVAEREAPDAGPSPSPAAPDQPDPANLAVQQWLREQLGGMQIAVDGEYGRWDAERLQVVPPASAMQQPAAPTPTS